MTRDPLLKFLTRHLASRKRFNPILVSVIILMSILRRHTLAERAPMTDITPNPIDALQAQITPVRATDRMSEAARKALLKDFVRMLRNEAGSLENGDLKPVHDMRVATRRMRSVFQLLGDDFKPKAVKDFSANLRAVARALGPVRDLDVILENLLAYRAALDTDDQAALDQPIALLRERRDAERKTLAKVIGKKRYRRFVGRFEAFVTTPDADALPTPDDDLTPTEARYRLPVAAYERLAAVRAYDRLIAEADDTTLHNLRIELKRLRYLLSFFEDILGKSGSAFIDEIKVLQDHLGHLQDAAVAERYLQDLTPALAVQERAAVERYLASLRAEHDRLRASFPEAWRHFNSRVVQRRLGNAVSGL